MSDPDAVLTSLAQAEDTFSHATGDPVFEPALDAGADAAVGTVPLQKACRLLELAHRIPELGAYYGAILEASFIAIEHTLQGYLLVLTGVEAHDLRDHDRPYRLAKGQVPLENGTLDRLERLYSSRRTAHYYGTTVTTEQQARAMREVASGIHDHIVAFEHALGQFCNCGE